MSYRPTHPTNRSLNLRNIHAGARDSTLGQPDEQQVKTWGWEAARFISSELGDGTGKWRGVKPLGKGSFGIVGLWEKVNNSGEVVDQVAIKEENYTRGSHIPPEVEAMKLLNDTGCQFVVKLRGYQRYASERRQRTYMEFCPHGDLQKLIKRYKLHKRYLPEPFLWHVFQSLAEAAFAMEYGPFVGDDERPLDFEIIHRDIKPANIFLGDENRGPEEPNFPYYPTPKLGDFGLAAKTSRYDIRNPRMFDGMGSRPYRAPEQCRNSDRFWNPVFRHENNKILSWTNVYAIGLVMYELCTLQRFTKKHTGHPDYEGDGLEPISTGKREEYSHELRELIRECLRPATDMRPSTRKLIRLTGRHASNWHDAYDLRKYPVHPIPEERVYYQGNEIDELKVGDDSEGESEEKLDTQDLSNTGEVKGGFNTITGSSEEKRRGKSMLPRTPSPEPEIDHQFFHRYEAAVARFNKAEKRKEAIKEARLKGVEFVDDDPSFRGHVSTDEDEEKTQSPDGDMEMEDVIYADEGAETDLDDIEDDTEDAEMTEVSNEVDEQPKVGRSWGFAPALAPFDWLAWIKSWPERAR